MKKPLFNQEQRWLMREGNTLAADAMKLYLARKRFQVEFLKSIGIK